MIEVGRRLSPPVMPSRSRRLALPSDLVVDPDVEEFIVRPLVLTLRSEQKLDQEQLALGCHLAGRSLPTE
jgi:hypothetical protein